MRALVAFGCGVVFALGLVVGGMTQPSKVVAFLDVTGAWDPSLAFVMLGAIGVHLGFVRLARRRAAPLMGERFDWPERARIDRALVVGAAVFGIGWGASGFCPGPALVSLGTRSAPTVAFVVAMALAAVVTRAIRTKR